MAKCGAHKPVVFVTYAIADPRSGRYVYVGQTKNFESRRRNHLRLRDQRPRIGTENIRTWLFDRLSAGEVPKIVELETCSTLERSLASESRWVERLARDGHPLLNRWRDHRKVIKSMKRPN